MLMNRLAKPNLKHCGAALFGEHPMVAQHGWKPRHEGWDWKRLSASRADQKSDKVQWTAINWTCPRFSLDGGTPSLQVSLPFVFHVEANATPWQNTIQPVDVNRDGTVLPLDALLGINALNSNQFVQTGNRLPLPFGPAFASLDVNGDGILSPIDILLVINHLNNSAQPESEAGTLCLPPVISRNRITSLVISRVSSRVAFPVDLSIASEVIDPAVADHIFTGIVADDLQETRIKATHHRLGLHGRHHAKPSTAGCPRKR